MLTRTHYRQLAEAVVDWGEENVKDDQYFADFVNNLCDVLAKTNPEFSSVRFVAACFKGR